MASASIETSIIIRTKNEEKWLGAVLGALFEQTYKDFEVIIVDSGSGDKTLEIAEKFPVKIFKIVSGEFSYPFALNYGIGKSEASKFVVIISGHSLPVSRTWLADGIINFSRYENLMGVYGFIKAMPGASLCDNFIDLFWRLMRPIRYGFSMDGRYVIKNGGMGVMGFTNAIIRKDLWEKRKFNEEYGLGGEDGEWAGYWFSRGYIAVRDVALTVCHSHNLGPLGWYKQFQYWKSLGSPHPFQPLSFRKDTTHKK